MININQYLAEQRAKRKQEAHILANHSTIAQNAYKRGYQQCRIVMGDDPDIDLLNMGVPADKLEDFKPVTQPWEH